MQPSECFEEAQSDKNDKTLRIQTYTTKTKAQSLRLEKRHTQQKY